MTADARAVEELLAGAAEWRLLSLLVSRPRDGWTQELAALAREVRDGVLRRAAADAGGAREGAYHALLGAGGPASPREAAHLGFGDPGRLLADLAARYAAFGYAPRAEEPDDHLAVECGFVAYLFLKEAYALAAGRGGRAELTREARARFLSEHVAVTGRRFASRLPDGAPAYLRATAEALAERLPAVPPVPEVPQDEDPLGCGGLPRR
jgi:hypothetical protein